MLISMSVYLCRDSTLEGFVGGSLVGHVALWSPVMLRHLRELMQKHNEHTGPLKVFIHSV